MLNGHLCNLGFLFIFISPVLEARGQELRKIVIDFFGEIEDKKKSFWNFLTFTCRGEATNSIFLYRTYRIKREHVMYF